MTFLHHTDAKITSLNIYSTAGLESGQNQTLTHVLQEGALHESLLQFFLKSFKEPTFYQFRKASENRSILKDAFEDLNDSQAHLMDLVKKAAAFNNESEAAHSFIITAAIENIIVEDEVVNAMAFFVTPDDPKFISIENQDSGLSLSLKKGFHQDKMYQGALIFDTQANTGYKICAKDRSKPFQTQTPWLTDFLQLTAMANPYLNTKETIKLTKQFVKEQAKESPQLDKTYEAEIMNNSLQYFQEETDFSQEEYTQRVFDDPSMQSEFTAYRDAYQENKERKLSDNFSVNLDAVKNQSKVFKSVLKLDKNFHVYIHGDRQLIEKGTDELGRKFYKLFYQEEK